MELLSNLMWLAVALALWAGWLVARRKVCQKSLLPRIGLQLVALGVLTAILLPVISITDDLQAGQNPAEVERSTVGRNERQLSAVPPSSAIPLTMALPAFFLTPQGSRTVEFLAREGTARRQFPGHLLQLWSRPPPAV